jgi:hypothetical protein
MSPTDECNGTEAPAAVLERRPELHAVARKVIATLEPLDPCARLRVLRAAAILLELDDCVTSAWMR